MTPITRERQLDLIIEARHRCAEALADKRLTPEARLFLYSAECELQDAAVILAKATLPDHLPPEGF